MAQATILSIVQGILGQLKLPSISTLVSNTDQTAVTMLALANRVVKDTARELLWPQLIKTATIRLVNGQANYALPSDFDAFIGDTIWYQAKHWPLRGSIDPTEWQTRQWGVVSQLSRQRFRIIGYASKQLYLTPTPDSSDIPTVWATGQTIAVGDYRCYGNNSYVAASAGTTGVTPPTHTTGSASDGAVSWTYYADVTDVNISFEYRTRICVLPPEWVALATVSSTFPANYCSYNGNIYLKVSGTTTGSTPPTHTSGSVSDGGVTWAASSIIYSSFLSDSDTPILDEEVIENEIAWRYLQASGLDYSLRKAEAEQSRRERLGAILGAGPISMLKRPSMKYISGMNVRDTDWGQ